MSTAADIVADAQAYYQQNHPTRQAMRGDIAEDFEGLCIHDADDLSDNDEAFTTFEYQAFSHAFDVMEAIERKDADERRSER